MHIWSHFVLFHYGSYSYLAVSVSLLSQNLGILARLLLLDKYIYVLQMDDLSNLWFYITSNQVPSSRSLFFGFGW